MRFRGTLVLFALCLALGVFVYFYEIRGGEERAKAKEEANRLWKVESADIQQIEIAAGDERVAAVREGEKQWKITEPRSLDADGEELNRLAGSAAGLNRESVTEPEASDLSKYGLDPPQHTFSFRTKEGKEFKVRFGNNNPTGSSTYAALEGSKEVFLVASYSASGLKKKLEDLRNRSILSFDQYEAQTLEIQSEKGPVSLVKENDRWWLQHRQKWAADSSEVNAILSALSTGRLKEFFDGDPGQYADLGFDKPLADVRATVGKDKAIRHLQVGRKKSELVKKGEPSAKAAGAESADTLYIARDESRPDLFYVDKEFVDKLLKSPSDLRNKALALFQRWDIDEVVLNNPNGSFTFRKSETGSDWVVGEDKKKAKWDAVNGVLDSLEKNVMEFIDDPHELSRYGLEEPAIKVIVKQKGEEKVECSFGSQTDSGVYAQVKGESTVKVAEKDILDKLNKKLEDYLEPPPAPAAEEPKK